MELRLLIIADDPLARTGLVALFANQPECEVIGQVDSETELLSDLELYQPDVLLWDMGWNPKAILEKLEDLRDSNVPAVLLLHDVEYGRELWALGVHGLLLRDADAKKLVAAIVAAAQGLLCMDPELRESLLPFLPDSHASLTEALTPRELEVLKHLAEGLPNKTIARRLQISEHTVKFHVNAIMGKFGAQSRTEAVVRATQLGLILL